MAKKEGKKKSGAVGIISIILIPILILVLVASSFYAIIDGIVNIIKELVGEFVRAITDFMENPIEFVGAKWAALKNFFNKIDGKGKFNPENYEFYNTKDDKDAKDNIRATIVISNDTFETMKESLNEVINRNAALLDDIMLKKMLLTYYRGNYLNDTEVLIELTAEDLNISNTEWEDELWKEKKWTEDEWKHLFGSLVLGNPLVTGAIVIDNFKETTMVLQDGKLEWLNNTYDFYPYEIIAKSFDSNVEDDKNVEEGHLYLKTTGMVEIYVACDKCNGLEEKGNSIDTVDCEDCKDKKLIYFTEDILELMYEKEYLAMLDKCNDDCKAGVEKCYAHSALEYLKKAYTYSAKYTKEKNEQTGEEKIINQSDSIQMYSLRTNEDELATIEYLNESETASEPYTGWERIKSWFSDPNANPLVRNYVAKSESPVTLQTINYGEKVAEYATPMELMVDLLNITSSKDFVNAFIETVGNENYIKLKLYTIRDRDINCAAQEFDRETNINAETKGEFVATVAKRNKDGIGVDNAEDENAEIEVRFSVNKDKNKITINRLVGADNDYHYKIKISIKYPDGTSKTILSKNDSEWIKPNGKIYNENKRYVIELPAEILTLKWKDTSTVMKMSGTSKITDQYYPAISELKTWYGMYQAVNSINREYDVKQTITDDKITLNDALLKEGLTQEIIDALCNILYKGENIKEVKKQVVAYDGEGTNVEKDINITLEDATNLNKRYNEQYTISDFYNELINKLDKNNIKLLPILYSDVEDYDDNWNTVSNFYSGNVIRVRNYSEMVNYENYWGEITWNVNSNSGFTEDEIRNAQLNYIIQKTKELNSEEIKSLSYIEKYEITNMTQTDKNLAVTDVTMHYTETVQEGLNDGNRLPNNDKIQQFLGLLCNKDGKYKLGEKFKPESSGGQPVDYEDVQYTVASRFEENEKMLYQLLNDFPRTQRLVKVMKIIMYIYQNNIHEVNEWQFDVYGDGMVNVYNSSGGMIDITE